MEETQNQQNQQNQQDPREPFIRQEAERRSGNKKNIVIISVIIALLLISSGIWLYLKKQDSKPMPYANEEPSFPVPPQIIQDTTSAINNDLNNINIESIDDSFKEIDADLNNL